MVVIGGGISGLAAAWKAKNEADLCGLDLEILVLESAPAVGGKALSVRTDDLLIEAGPQGFLNDEPVMDQLIEAAGLEKEVLQPRESGKRRFLYHRGRLREISPHPIRFASSGVLGPLGLLRLATEPFRAKADPDREETLLEFGARRLGRQAAERLLGPAALGVFAGDAAELCATSAFPRLTAMEQEHGSLFRGLLDAQKQSRLKPGLRGLHGLRRGLQSLASELSERAGFEVRCHSAVETIECVGRPGAVSGFVVRTNVEEIVADAVVVATDLRASQSLLSPLLPEAASALGEIPCPDVLVVALAYPRAAIRDAPTGYGVLIPRSEGLRMLGCQWESDSFEGRSPDDIALFRCIYGGAVDPEAPSLVDDDAFELAERELAQILGVSESRREAALNRHLFRWPAGIPQYTLGHAARIERVETALAQLPGLFLAGNSLYGVGFSKAAATGAERGEQAVEWLAAH